LIFFTLYESKIIPSVDTYLVVDRTSNNHGILKIRYLSKAKLEDRAPTSSQSVLYIL